MIRRSICFWGTVFLCMVEVLAQNDANAQQDDLEIAISLQNDLYMNGGDEATVTWAVMESMILSKIGDSGITKQEFERDYRLDVYGDYSNLPCANPSLVAGNNDKPGPLYTRTWQAKRYFKKNGAAPTSTIAVASGKDYVPAIDGDKVECDDDSIRFWTNNNNHFGEVWYTPHDNDTEGHNWDEQTNVLIWNFYHGDGTADEACRKTYVAFPLTQTQAGNMYKEKYWKLIQVSGATYLTKGQNMKDVSTVVRFINKISGKSIWVTLQVSRNKIFFAYADVYKRVLAHWYDSNTGYKDNTPDTIEVYANFPTPADINRVTGVTVSGFTKNLTEYWLNQNINDAVVFHGSTRKFSKFVGKYADGSYKNYVYFRFRLPEKGLNADFSADYKGRWTVPGASGTTWTVELNAAKTEILATFKNGVPYGPTVICTLTPKGTIHWNGRTEGAVLFDNRALAPNKEDVNEPANDILNYIGMFDKKGNNQKNIYLSGQKDKTFAAYVEVFVENDNYDPIIGKNYFNVRFLRPINVWPTEAKWTSGPNTTQVYDIWRLINIRDWRTYPVVMDNQMQKLDDSDITYEGKFADGEKASVPYSFYNITNVYVERAAIKSDAYLEPLKRVITDNPGSLLTIDQIPALTGKNDGVVNWEYLKIMPVGTSTEVAGKTAIGLPESTQSGDILAYTNNGGVVKPFHVYVPIKVVYSHGALKPWTQTVWAVITVNESANQNEYNLTIRSSGNGSVLYNNSAIRGQEESFTVTEGNNSVLSFLPDDGYRIKAVGINGINVLSNISNNQYTINNIRNNTLVEVLFERDEQEKVIQGDVNGDLELNVSDIVEVVNYIMNNASAIFLKANADLNGDGEVNVTDIVMMVNIIMSGQSGAARQTSNSAGDLTDGAP